MHEASYRSEEALPQADAMLSLEHHPYNSIAYAHAFLPAYEPIYLPHLKIFVLKRPIPGTAYFDAIGCYPLSPLRNFTRPEADFQLLLEQGIVSLVLVTGPFFCPKRETLQDTFDLVMPYKEHCLRIFSRDFHPSQNHRYEVRRARKLVELKKIMLGDYLSEWQQLYGTLIKRHAITGVQAFSPDYFKALAAQEPIMFGAFQGEEMVSAQLWFEFGGFAYNHLLASSEEGYVLRAANAVQDEGLRYFAQAGIGRVTLGSSPGAVFTPGGLYRFKRRFSNATAPGYLCGKIIDRDRYAQLSRFDLNPSSLHQAGATDFFPAYRR